MVRTILLGMVLLGLSSPVSAQTVDWRKAGGDLFGKVLPEPEVPTGATEIARLDPLSQPFQEAIETAALAHGLDPKLLHALVVTESAYRADALSPAGAAA